jgi:8-oxo-dGTP pyrophosphatase MutT (NUDIX family)
METLMTLIGPIKTEQIRVHPFHLRYPCSCFPEFCLMQLPTAGLLVIENRKLLLAYSRNKQCFYLPGGKIDEGETATSALCREIEEEMNVALEETDLHYYTHISAPAYGEVNGTIMEQDCFLLNKKIIPSASAEVGELKYFSLEEYLLEENKAPGAVMILEQLKADNLID